MKTLDPCPACKIGRMLTTCTRRRAGRKLRYLRCSLCGHRGKEVVESSTILVSTGRENGQSAFTIKRGAIIRRENTMPEQLLDIHAAAQICGLDAPTFKDLFDFGDAPMPLIIGGMARWSRSVLDKWIANGCPATDEPDDDAIDAVVVALLDELRRGKARCCGTCKVRGNGA